jgi:DNA-binding CsgD family transcriptional regulator
LRLLLQCDERRILVSVLDCRVVPRPTRLSHRDYDGAIRLAADAAAAEGIQPFGLRVIEQLLQLIPADHAGYYDCAGGGYFYVERPSDRDQIDWTSEVVNAAAPSCPLLDCELSASALPLKLSDFLSPALLRRNPWYVEMSRPRGVEYWIKTWLPAPPGAGRGFFLVRERGRRDFDERDRAVLTLLRPHLASIRERWERSRSYPHLTPRESEVLDLVAEGLSNSEIGARLVISPGTVRRHLENLFEKLGVNTRTAAAAWLNNLRKTA